MAVNSLNRPGIRRMVLSAVNNANLFMKVSIDLLHLPVIKNVSGINGACLTPVTVFSYFHFSLTLGICSRQELMLNCMRKRHQ